MVPFRLTRPGASTLLTCLLLAATNLSSLLAVDRALAAQVVADWSAPEGSWLEPLNWSGAVVPQNFADPATTYQVRINNGGTCVLEGIGPPVAIDTLLVGAGNSLYVYGGLLVQQGSVVNQNAINIYNELRLTSGGTIENQFYMELAGGRLSTYGDALLRGGGTVRLLAGAPGVNVISANNVAPFEPYNFTNVDNLVAGVGYIGEPGYPIYFANEDQGRVRADVDLQTLEIHAIAGTNAGDLEAMNGGLLRLAGGDWINQGGNIRAFDDALIEVGSGIRIRGGHVGGGFVLPLVVLPNNFATLDGASHGAVQIGGSGVLARNGSNLTLIGEFQNLTTLSARPVEADTQIIIGDSPGQTVTLDGGGTVNLFPPLDTNESGRATMYAGVPGNQLVNENNTIVGAGHLGFGYTRLVNRGVIDGNDLHGRTLYVWPQDTFNAPPAANTGTIQATALGRLELTGRWDNAGGLIAARHFARVDLNYARISGGRIETELFAILATPDLSNSSVLENLTIDNEGTIIPGTSSGLTLRGTVGVNNPGIIAIAEYSGLTIDDADVDLSGDGALLMAGTIQGLGNARLHNDASHAIVGAGQIAGVQLTNAGIVAANDPTRPLVIDAAGVNVQGVGAGIFVAAGGTLRFQNGVIQLYDQSRIVGEEGVDIELDNASIAGGDIIVSNSGVLRNRSTAGLDGESNGPLELTGRFAADPGTTTHLAGEIVNHGTIDLGADAAMLVLDADVQLTGEGTLALGSAGNIVHDGVLRRLSLNGATLAGGGEIGVTVENGGTVRPGSATGRLTMLADYEQQESGVLSIDVDGSMAGEDYDQLVVEGSAELSGTLDVSLVGDFTPARGQAFRIIEAGEGILGQFDVVNVPQPTGLLTLSAFYGASAVDLRVVPALPGDANADGAVDLADLNDVRNHFGETLAGVLDGDTNGDQVVDLADLNAVRNHFGETVGAVPVPEPSSCALLFAGVTAYLFGIPWRRGHIWRPARH